MFFALILGLWIQKDSVQVLDHLIGQVDNSTLRSDIEHILLYHSQVTMLVILEVHLLLVVDKLLVMRDSDVLRVDGFSTNVEFWRHKQLLSLVRDRLDRLNDVFAVQVLFELLFEFLTARWYDFAALLRLRR